MKRAALPILPLLAALSLGASGCSAVNDFGRFVFGDDEDAGMADAGMDDAGMVDAGMVDAGMPEAGVDAGAPDAGDGGPPPVTGGPSSVVQTSGGAVIQTSEYRLRVSVGAPQPVGSASSAEHRLRTGPVTR